MAAAASATGGATSLKLSANLGFIPTKKQFKWNGSLASLKEFWISELEDGNSNSLVSINSNANTEVLKFEFVTVNFYTSTKTLQIQGASKDRYVEKLLHIVKKLNTTIEEDRNAEIALSTPNALNSETETATMAGHNSAHDDRYEEFKSFMKMQLEFNKKLESLITANSIGINEQVIELKDLEQKCKNQTREVNLACDSSIHAIKIELSDEIQKLVKQISNLSTKLSAELKALKTKAKSIEDSVNHIVQQLGEIKNQVCVSEESLISHMHDASRQDSQSQTKPNERTFAEVTANNVDLQTLQRTATEEIIAEVRDQTFTVNTYNRFAVLDPQLPERQTQVFNEQSTQPASTATAAMTREHSNSSDVQQGSLYNHEARKETKKQPEAQNGPILMIGDSILRGIQQRKFCPQRFVNKQYVPGGTREMKQHIEAMVDRNVYDHIIVHSGTNDVDKLRVNDIATNMESCVITLKGRWPNAQIALSGLTYAPKGDNTKIDDINYCYEAICSEHNITYINNQRVTVDTFGNIDPEVFFDDLHLNNKIGTKRLVTNIKSSTGLRREGNREQANWRQYNSSRLQNRRWNSRQHNLEFPPLQALNALADYFKKHHPR